jgi:hypothetical protein
VTALSIFSRRGGAYILMGMSISVNGRMGKLSPDDPAGFTIFFGEVQAKKITGINVARRTWKYFIAHGYN